MEMQRHIYTRNAVCADRPSSDKTFDDYTDTYDKTLLVINKEQNVEKIVTGRKKRGDPRTTFGRLLLA